MKTIQSTIIICPENYQPYELLSAQQPIDSKTGAQSTFIGYMRDFREDSQVDRMFVEYYPQMTEHQIQKLADQLVSEFKLIHLFVAHRVGEITPTQAIVTISATAPHRTNAIEATKKMLEMLKHHAPFWKKEFLSTQSSWVDKNTDDKLH